MELPEAAAESVVQPLSDIILVVAGSEGEAEGVDGPLTAGA